MSRAELRERWVKVTCSALPRISPKLLRLALAWEIQAKAYGGHSRETTRMLDQLERGLTKTTGPGPACGWFASGRAGRMWSRSGKTR
jgi:hypothetical protein